MDIDREIGRLMAGLNRAKITFYNEKGKKEQMLERKKLLEANLDNSYKYIEILEKVRILLQKTSEYAREKSKDRIESIVTNCLQYIFDQNMEFVIEINEMRGRPEAEFFVTSSINGEKVKTKPQDARGGGIIDVISLSLRIAMLQLNSLEINGPLILDEPAKHVSEEYINQVAEFLKGTSEKFDRQVIMVTHNRNLCEIADRLYRIEMQDGISRASFFS